MAVGGYQDVVKCMCVSLEQTNENVSLGTSWMWLVLWTCMYAVLFISWASTNEPLNTRIQRMQQGMCFWSHTESVPQHQSSYLLWWGHPSRNSHAKMAGLREVGNVKKDYRNTIWRNHREEGQFLSVSKNKHSPTSGSLLLECIPGVH